MKLPFSFRMLKLFAITVTAMLLSAVVGRYVIPTLLAGWTEADGMTSTRTAPPTLMRLAELAQLLTLRVEVSDVLVTRVDGFMGGAQVVLVVHGDADLEVDLSQAKFEQIEPAARAAVVVLPPPRPAAARLDHEHTKIASLSKDGLWVLAPTEKPYVVVVEKALAAAQRRVEVAAADRDAVQVAQKHAEEVTSTFFRALDWTVNVRWKQPSSVRD